MGKLIMFFGWIWFITCLAGSIMTETVPMAATKLTANITASSVIIAVKSTNGFPEPGILVIGTERIAYSHKTSTLFLGNWAQPLVRGTDGTDAAAHSKNDSVRSPESALMNNSIDYDLAVLADAAGAQAFLSVPTAVFSLIASFATSPFGFLGSGFAWLTAIWAVCVVGMLVAFFISISGGRRV